MQYVAHHLNTAMEYIVFWSYHTTTILLLCPHTDSAKKIRLCAFVLTITVL